MTSTLQALKIGMKDARKYRQTRFVLVRSRDDFGEWTVEHCPETAADLLYPGLKHGIATIVGRFQWDAKTKDVAYAATLVPYDGRTMNVHSTSPEPDRTVHSTEDEDRELDDGQRMAMSELCGLMGQD